MTDGVKGILPEQCGDRADIFFINQNPDRHHGGFFVLLCTGSHTGSSSRCDDDSLAASSLRVHQSVDCDWRDHLVRLLFLSLLPSSSFLHHTFLGL
jgi:hypothetical protein